MSTKSDDDSSKPRRLAEETPKRMPRLLQELRKNYPRSAASQTAEVPSQAAFANILTKHVRTNSNNEAVFQFTKNTVANLESRRIPVRFAHLEAYAKAVNMRTGWLLLFSQHMDTSEPRDLDRLRTQALLLSDLCEKASNAGRSLNIDDIFELGKSFEDHGFSAYKRRQRVKSIKASSSKRFDFEKFGERLAAGEATKDEIKVAISALMRRL